MLQQKPALAASTTSTTTSSNDIYCLVAAMDQQYKDAHDLKEETLIPYDSTSGKRDRLSHLNNVTIVSNVWIKFPIFGNKRIMFK